MIATNEFFNHPDRAAYELAYLLRALPQHFDIKEALSGDQVLQVKAAETHAENYTDILLHGIESIGHLMYSAGNNENAPLKHFASLGALVGELAGQLQFLDEFRTSVADRKLQLALRGGAQ
jgi:hypothetical protein